MQLNVNLWYVRWFFWNLDVLDHFCKTEYKRRYDSSYDKYENGTNLCHFFRTLLLGTIVSGMTTALYGAFVFGLFILPFILFPVKGIFGVLAVLLLIVVAAVAFVSFFYGMTLFIPWVWTKLKQTASKMPVKNPSFVKLGVQYVVSTKEKFCPIIKFEEK